MFGGQPLQLWACKQMPRPPIQSIQVSGPLHAEDSRAVRMQEMPQLQGRRCLSWGSGCSCPAGVWRWGLVACCAAAARCLPPPAAHPAAARAPPWPPWRPSAGCAGDGTMQPGCSGPICSIAGDCQQMGVQLWQLSLTVLSKAPQQLRKNKDKPWNFLASPRSQPVSGQQLGRQRWVLCHSLANVAGCGCLAWQAAQHSLRHVAKEAGALGGRRHRGPCGQTTRRKQSGNCITQGLA